jgi:hypothetical protein
MSELGAGGGKEPPQILPVDGAARTPQSTGPEARLPEA